MAYSRWATAQELKEKLNQVSYDFDIKKSGIPMMYDENHLYIKDDIDHTLVIGSTGSDKTQLIMLPQIRLAIKAGESLIVHDVKGDIFKLVSEDLTKQNYAISIINLDNPSEGNNFNPLSLPYELYKNNQKDEAIELLENIGYYFCCNETFNVNADPFWVNSSISLFVGLSLYLFENFNKEEVNISSLLNLATDFDNLSEQVKMYDKTSSIYINLSNIILAPVETRGGIISVFIQNMKLFASRETLLKILLSSNFDIKSIQKNKTAIFIISNNKPVSRRLVPLIIEECCYAATNADNKIRRLNIVVDDFENLVPINNFSNMLTLARGSNIKFSIFIRSLFDLRNVYGTEGTEILKMMFEDIIYLLSNDTETLEDISKLCGNQRTENGVEPLISVEDLKLLNTNEAIILIPRMYPIRTNLLFDYQVDWKFNNEK